MSPVKDFSQSPTGPHPAAVRIPPEADLRGESRPQPGAELDDLVASELMTPGVVTVPDDISVRRGMSALASHQVHAALVVGARSGTPLGWITAEGLLGRLEGEAERVPVYEAITQKAVSATPGTTAREVTTLLSQPGISHLLVAAAAGRLPQGVITALDLLRAVAP